MGYNMALRDRISLSKHGIVGTRLMSLQNWTCDCGHLSVATILDGAEKKFFDHMRPSSLCILCVASGCNEPRMCHAGLKSDGDEMESMDNRRSRRVQHTELGPIRKHAID